MITIWILVYCSVVTLVCSADPNYYHLEETCEMARVLLNSRYSLCIERRIKET